MSPASKVALSIPLTMSRWPLIHFLLPMITFGICDRYSLVETIDTRPPFFSATVTSPGVQVTTPSTQRFSLAPVLMFFSSVQKPLTYFWPASM